MSASSGADFMRRTMRGQGRWVHAGERTAAVNAPQTFRALAAAFCRTRRLKCARLERRFGWEVQGRAAACPAQWPASARRLAAAKRSEGGPCGRRMGGRNGVRVSSNLRVLPRLIPPKPVAKADENP